MIIESIKCTIAKQGSMRKHGKQVEKNGKEKFKWKGNIMVTMKTCKSKYIKRKVKQIKIGKET